MLGKSCLRHFGSINKLLIFQRVKECCLYVCMKCPDRVQHKSVSLMCLLFWEVLHCFCIELQTLWFFLFCFHFTAILTVTALELLLFPWVLQSEMSVPRILKRYPTTGPDSQLCLMFGLETWSHKDAQAGLEWSLCPACLKLAIGLLLPTRWNNKLFHQPQAIADIILKCYT